MEAVIVVTRILHIGLAAAWFGHKLLIPFDLGEATRNMRGADGGLLARMERAQRLGLVTGFGTLGSGIVLTLLIGPRTVPGWIYVGLVLVLAMFAIGALVARPAWIRLRASIESSDSPSALAAAEALSRALNIESVVWMAVLVMMVI